MEVKSIINRRTIDSTQCGVDESIYSMQLRRYTVSIQSPQNQICIQYTEPESTLKLLQQERDNYWKYLQAITVFMIWRERC
jgi:hypothetical protein